MKFLFKVLLYLFILTNFVRAEIVNEIVVEGNKRISLETVITLGDLNKTYDYDENKINNSLKTLYESEFFENITIKITDNKLIVSVIENPIIEDIEITGIKNKSFLDKVYENINIKNRKPFVKENLKTDIDLIRNILKSNGFYFSEISTSLVENKEFNSIRIRINIEEGKKAKIKNIFFTGDKKIKTNKLKEIIVSEEHKFWKFISNNVYLNETKLNLDKRLLERYYKNLGYHNVKINESFAEFNKEGYFNLIFNINSGNQYLFNNFILNIPEDYDPKDFDRIQKIFNKLKGEKYSIDNIDKILLEIEKIASSKLYDFIDASVDETILEDYKIDYSFNLFDSKKYYVERIDIIGNFTTLEEVIRNKFVIDEGDPFNNLLYNKSLDEIRSIGFFNKVNSKIKDGKDENFKIIEIEVEEKPTGEISLAAGVGTSGSVIGGGISENNFLGKGIRLTSNLELSEDSIKGLLAYSKPNFAYSDNTLTTSIRSTSTNNLSDFGYKTSDIGFAVGTVFEQYENLFFSPEISINFQDLYTNSNASNALKKQEGSYEDFYFNYGLDYDLRDSKFNPKTGFTTSIFQELPIISSNNEISNTFIFSKYKKLDRNEEMIGKASLYIKNILSLDKDIRISKRAQIPYNRLRGFEKGKVGPVDGSDYIGGNYVTALNLSTTIPGLFRSVENVDFSYFIDLANVWGVDYDDSINDSNKIRSSTGVGMNLLSPIGPLSFSFTKPISKIDTDKTETFRFNLGTTF